MTEKLECYEANKVLTNAIWSVESVFLLGYDRDGNIYAKASQNLTLEEIDSLISQFTMSGFKMTEQK